MHIKISKSEALNTVQVVVASKATLPVLQNVKLTAKGGKVELTCSDLDITLRANADCEVIEEGATTIPAKPFAAAVGKLIEGEVKLEVDQQDKTTLSAGTSVFKFKGLPASEFPEIPSEEGDKCSIDSNILREMLRKVSFATSQDDTRRTLQGLLIDFLPGSEVKAVATDGRRMALLECEVDTTRDFNGKFILPKKAVDVLLKKLPKEGNAEITSSNGKLLVKTTRIEVLMKLIDDEFPNYMQVMPKQIKFTIPVNRVDLVGALDRVSVLTAGEDAPCIVLTFADNVLTLNSSDTEVGSSRDEVPIKYSDEKIEMRFNPQYIREVLNVIDEDEVDILLNNGSSPAIVRKGGSDDYNYVVMPLRV